MKKVKEYSIDQQLELYMSMIKAQPQSMFIMDRDKNLIGIFNAAPEALAGYTVDDLIGNSILKYANDPLSPFYQACSMLNSTFDPVFKTGIPLKFQYMILDTYFEATIAKISGDRILSQVRDISDIILKLRNVEKKKHNEISIALIAGGLSSWSYDVERNTISSTHINNNNIKGDILLDEFLLRINPIHRNDTIKMFNDIIERKCDHASITVLAEDYNGDVLWTNVHAVPHEISPEGEVLSIIGSQKDVTQEYEHNENLKRLNLQNELILNNTNSGFAYLTVNLDVEWQNISNVFSNIEITKAFERKNIYKIIHEQQAGVCVAAAAISRAIETKHEATCKYKTCNNMIIESIAKPIFNNDNTFGGIVVRLDDITDKEKSIFELAKSKEKAERADKLKSAFLANMSHEIRTPLNSIVGFAQLLSDTNSLETQQEYTNIISSNSHTLLNLINDILDLSKIEAGYLNCENTPFSLNELFSELSFTFKNKVRDDVELICEVPEEEIIVNLDRVRISQVISNFITNAIKFTHKGHIKIKLTQIDKKVKIEITDTGCGMNKEQLLHVFDRFEKLNSFEQGTGLGTSIAKAIVDIYNGEIGATSVVGAGSTFWVLLPTNTDNPSTEDNAKINKQKEETKVDASSIRILIAEDNNSNYMLINVLLKEYNLTRAVNGQEAVELAKNGSFDIILMDIKMPIMDGLEATKTIRQFNTSIPIVALTANAFDDDRRRALDSGMNAFLTKPLNKNELLKIIGDIL